MTVVVNEEGATPYEWKQTLADVDISLPLPSNTRARDMEVRIQVQHLYIRVKSSPDPIFNVLDLLLLRWLIPMIHFVGTADKKGECG